MKIEEIIENSKLQIDPSNILYNVDMKKYTTFKIGGAADCLIKIQKTEELEEILSFVKKENISFTIIGNGSNILVDDGGIRGIVLKIDIKKFNIQQIGNKIELNVGAGDKLTEVAQKLLRLEVSGFEELSGIPGTIGGAIRMNAGAHGKEMKDIVKTIKCIDFDGNIYEFSNKEAEFGYRKSKFSKEKYIILEAKIQLEKGKKEEIQTKMKKYANYRKEKQPIEFPSAGSTFKRGEDFITAKLIDECGLKGYKVGGAQVSEKHAGFVINKDNATAKDVKELIEHVKNEVFKKFNKKIELEIEVIGESDNERKE